MTKEDIIAMAREAGASPYTNRHYPDRPTHTFNVEQLERFAKLVRDDYSNKHANLWLDRCHKFMLEEREACAKVCEDLDLSQDSTWQVATLDCADAIRARGNNRDTNE